jgi:hypothetical protein
MFLPIGFNQQLVVNEQSTLNLDASDRNSYAGSGATWTDLSRSAYTGSLVNGPTFDSANGGSIVFDGTNDLTNLPAIAFSTNPFTIDIWFKMNGSQIQNSTLIAVAAAATANNWQLSFTSGTSLQFFYKGPNLADSFSLNTTFISGVWTNVIITKDSNNDIRSYVNGIQTATVNYAANYNHTEILRLALNRGGTAYYNGSISICRLYNGKGFTSADVLQNYNATRDHYGI